MTFTGVMVPGPLLIGSGLSKSAQLVWMLLQLPAAKEGGPLKRPGHLHDISGVARSTVRSALSELERGDWLATTPHSGSTQPSVTMPVELLTDKRLGMREKLLYGVLQLSPGFHHAAGHFTYASLSALAGVGFSTAKRAVRALCLAGWLQVAKSDKFRPIHFALRNPAVERYNHAVSAINRRFDKQPHKGEALMREYLSLIINSDDYDDDASPAWLLNPYTGEELQFDRYYTAGVAWEYNGPQHYSPTEQYPGQDEARKQRARDHIKAGICKDRQIHLILVHADDLGFTTMRQKVGGLMPQRDLRGAERVIAYLDRLSRTYRQKAEEGSAGAHDARP